MSISTFGVRERIMGVAFFIGVVALLLISVPTTASAAFSPGRVTITVDDGWKNSYDSIMTANVFGSFKTTQYIYSDAMNQKYLGAGNAQIYTNATQVKAMFDAGHEIGAHTRSHANLLTGSSTAATSTFYTYEINGSKSDLGAVVGSGNVTSFAYPYGAYDQNTINALTPLFTNARTTDDENNGAAAYNVDVSQPYTLQIGHVTSTTTLPMIKSWISQATSTNTWLILMFHQIVPTVNTSAGNCIENTDECSSRAFASATTAFLAQNRVCVQTMAQVIAGTSCNTAPVLAAIGDKSVTTTHALTFTAQATDANSGDTLTYSATPLPAGATINSTTGAFFWAPTAQQVGATTTTISVSDGQGGTDSETITITVSEFVLDPNNPSPVAQAQSVSVTQNSSVNITLVATDTGSSTLSWSLTAPSHGSLTGSAPSTTYTPTASYYGQDSFTFNVNDGNSSSNTATVAIQVNPLPSCPSGYTLGSTTGMCDATNASTTPQSVSPCPTGYHIEGAVCLLDVPTPPTPPPSGGGGSSSSGGGGGGGGGGNNTTYSIKINGGDSQTSSRNVTVVLHRSSNNAVYVWLSNDDTFSSGDWQTYDSNKEFTLSAGAGTKTVYVRFGDQASHVLSTKSDTIELKATAGGEVLGTSTQATTGSSAGGSSGGLSSAQIASILGLLRSFGADADVINKVTLALKGQVIVGAPIVSSGFVFTQALSLGSSGNEVSELQKRLTQEGLYSGPVTGYFGPLTKAAVIAYQQKKGVPALGFVGPLTRAKLNGK